MLGPRGKQSRISNKRRRRSQSRRCVLLLMPDLIRSLAEGRKLPHKGATLRQEIKLQIIRLLKARIPVPRQLSEEAGRKKTIKAQPPRLVGLQQNKARQKCQEMRRLAAALPPE